MEKVDDERLVRETERLFEHLEEEDSKDKKAKVSESSGDGKAVASSSGPAPSRGEAPRSSGGVPMAADSGDGVAETVKRKIGDSEPGEGEDSKDKKNITGKEEEKGAKRSMDEWEEFAKKMKTGAEARAEESKRPGEGMDINQFHVAREIGAVSMGKSDVKFDETVFDFINSAWREYEEELYYDAISGEVMIKELVEAARKVEMETFKKHGVCQRVPIEE